MTARQGFWAVLLSSFCFGFLGYFGTVGYELGFTPLKLLTVRFVLASLMLWGFAAAKYKQRPKNKNPTERPLEKSSYSISINNVKWLALQGVAYAFTALGYFNALRNMPAGLVGVLFYVHPLLTIFMASLIWRETVSKVVMQSAVLAVVGAALVSQSGGAASAAGNTSGLIWIAVAASSYSAFTLIGQKTTSDLDSLVVTTYSITFCAVFLVLLNPPLYMLNGTLSPNMWLVGLGISFVSSVLAILLYVVGIKAVGASRAAIISAAEPLSGVLIATLLLGERLAAVQVLGIAVILLSVWNTQRRTNPLRPTEG
ncbi:MAG: hypothetical protein FD169_2373 [Bacillota bacterium]|nr:MAG: hypothetical protein FD169_2373 [Bacillota bacterium]